MTAKPAKAPRRPGRVARSSPVKQLPNVVSSSRYLFFGGKGGVGKTTAASATALFLLEQAKREESILLFSTDPAHSLSDSLGFKIGNRPTQVATRRRSTLIAYEMDATQALVRFREQHGPVLAEIAERGTLLDEADIDELLQLSLPGLDEVMALFELSELDRAGKYTRIVVDTAPSGHTSRLLRLPAVFQRMVIALDRLGEKHRYIVAHFARRRIVSDRVDLFLRDLTERIERVRTLLFTETQTSFVLVTIPEAMSVRETERYLAELRQQNVPVRDLIINRVEEQHGACHYCKARVASQKPWLEKMSKIFAGLEFHRVSLLPQEVRGLPSLQLVGKLIWKGERPEKFSKIGRSQPEKTKSITEIAASGFPLESRQIFIFGGKGGVGKTTAAASLALAMAEKDRQRRFLIFSTDPAHSLSDSFAVRVGEKRAGVAGIPNLDAMEIDPGKWFAELKQRYRSWTDQLFDSIASNSRLEIKFDREAMRELVELTPPGIDEIAALGVVSELLETHEYDVIVLDTAPTGHLLRFLELPEVALSWVKTFMKLLLKYQNVVQASQLAEELVALSKSLKRVRAILTDSRLCEFVGVAIPEQMSLEETKDLAKALQVLEIPFRRLLINGVIPSKAGACQFCDARRASQLSMLQAFRRQFGRRVGLFVAPQQEKEIQGTSALRRHFSSWGPLPAEAIKRGSHLRSHGTAIKNVTARRAKK